MGYLQLIHASNAWQPPQPDYLYRLYLPNDQDHCGLLLPHVVDRIPWPSTFKITPETRRVELLDPSGGKHTADVIEKALTTVIQSCITHDLFGILRNRDDERISILSTHHPARLCRYAQPLFGVIGQGAHLTAYTRTLHGLQIWVARRSATIDTSPNMLDNTAAGSVPAELTPFEALMDEAVEEASLPLDIIRRDARAAGTLTYVDKLNTGQADEHDLIVPHIIYVYDIELSQNLTPQPDENEVQAFYSMDINEVKSRLLNGEFKSNSAVVMIDFLVRHGYITSETDRDYAEITMALHRPLPLCIKQ